MWSHGKPYKLYKPIWKVGFDSLTLGTFCYKSPLQARLTVLPPTAFCWLLTSHLLRILSCVYLLNSLSSHTFLHDGYCCIVNLWWVFFSVNMSKCFIIHSATHHMSIYFWNHCIVNMKRFFKRIFISARFWDRVILWSMV